MKFDTAVELFLEYLKVVDRSPETAKGYKFYLLKFNKYLIEKYNRPVCVDEVTPDDFERYLFEPPNDKNLSQATRYTITTTFKSFYSFCFMKGYCDSNIGKKVVRIKARSKERTYITEEEMLRLTAAMPIEIDRVFIQTLFYSGLRIGEGLKLTLEDINFDGNYLYIKKHKSKYDRKVPISIKLGAILHNYLENVRPESESNKVFIFTTRKTENSIKSYINELLKKAAVETGLTIEISSHIMRHSFASNLIAKGVDIVKIQKLLGHEGLRTTNIYLHSNMQALKKAVSTL